MFIKMIVVVDLLLLLATLLMSDKCGMEGGKVDRISGGYPSQPNQYPWMVSYSYIRNATKYWCGGSLISDRLVLTAKHCTQQIDYWGQAKVGVHNVTKNSTDGEDVKFEEVFLHNTTDDNNDIAIILLKEPVDLEDPTIGTVCLPETEDEEYIGENVKGMGWGMIKLGKWGHLLKVVDLEVAKKERKYWIYTKLNKTEEVYQDPCAGDSGGPLVHKRGNQWIIIGTVYGEGYDCKTGNITQQLGSWNKVTAHLKWITEIIKNHAGDKNDTKETGTIDYQNDRSIQPHDHGNRNMNENYRNKNLDNNIGNTYVDNSHVNKYVGNTQRNVYIDYKFGNGNIGNNKQRIYVNNNQVKGKMGNIKTISIWIKDQDPSYIKWNIRKNVKSTEMFKEI